jgi:hypothetical protein
VNKVFRKYHRSIAIICCLPIALTILSGIGYTILDEILHIKGTGSLMMKIHTMSFLGLDKIYPILNGIGLIGLLVTGLTMTSLFRSNKSV